MLQPILLVEDNHDDVLFITRNLSVLANPVVVAMNGEQALEILAASFRRDHVPCLILLDLRLPKMSGLEVLQFIRGNEDTRNLPVLVLTGSESHEDTLNSYEYGANGVLHKPLDMQRFEKAVRVLGCYCSSGRIVWPPAEPQPSE